MNMQKPLKCAAAVLSGILVMTGSVGMTTAETTLSDSAKDGQIQVTTENVSVSADTKSEASGQWKAEITDYDSRLSLISYEKTPEVTQAEKAKAEEEKKKAEEEEKKKALENAEPSPVDANLTGGYVGEIPAAQGVAEPTPQSGEFAFTTYGWGHGVGLSQNGANAYAMYSGWTYQDILFHYYPGTYLMNTGTGGAETVTAGGLAGTKFGGSLSGYQLLRSLGHHCTKLLPSLVQLKTEDTLVKALKGNSEVSHIPVIMLSGKNKLQDRMEGIDTGADHYLSKPFYMSELKSIMSNLINNRLIVKGKYSGKQEQKDHVNKVHFLSSDEVLMKRIMEVVNKNLSNSSFNIESIVDEVGISRTQLHRKLKELTGFSAAKFVQNLRMQQAAELLKEGKANIAEIAYSVGFASQSHFATTFKQYYGLTPSEYLRQYNEENGSDSGIIQDQRQ